MRHINPKGGNTGGNIMKSFLKKIHRDGLGFTLVELLIAITNLGVLAILYRMLQKD